MTYANIVSILYERYSYQYRKKEIDFLLRQAFKVILNALADGEKVAIQDFASFNIVEHKRYKSKRMKIKPSSRMIRTIRHGKKYRL